MGFNPPSRPHGAASLRSQGENAVGLLMYLFGRDALTPGRGKEFNDKMQWPLGRRCSRLADGLPSIGPEISKRARS
ncbi:hypothetical protein, partial [Mesorhizobium sp.]|uniref:hypothetical protein n=1 Tax=Mesorhizobium sp. TaxID=1871066 RepID=UPI0025C133E8